MKAPLRVLGGGAVTAVGLNARSSVAAIRARISGCGPSSFTHQSFHDSPQRDFEPINHAQVPLEAPVDSDGAIDDFARLVQLASQAIGECLSGCGLASTETALVLGIREPARDHPDLDGRDDWIDAIERSLGSRFHRQSMVVSQGHTSTFEGLLHAGRILCDRTVSACIVGGVDSYLNCFDLERYVGAWRIAGPRVSRGFTPGEGAAFVAVAASAPDRKPEAIGIFGIGIADEAPACAASAGGHPTGRGLERALAAAAANGLVGESDVDLRISDLNGEQYRIDDSLLASVRFYTTYRHHLELWHPAQCVGEIGAASGALGLLVGLAALRQGYAPGKAAMCESASDSPRRAACLLARLGGPR